MDRTLHAPRRRGSARLLLPSLFALFFSAGCPGPEDAPPDAARPERDAAIDATSPADSGPSDAGPGDAGRDAFTPPDAFTFDAPGLDAYADDAFASPDAVVLPDAFECVAPEGCYRCTPTTSDQFLDRCTTATCQRFVNDRTRLPLLNSDGSLPPLP